MTSKQPQAACASDDEYELIESHKVVRAAPADVATAAPPSQPASPSPTSAASCRPSSPGSVRVQALPDVARNGGATTEAAAAAPPPPRPRLAWGGLLLRSALTLLVLFAATSIARTTAGAHAAHRQALAAAVNLSAERTAHAAVVAQLQAALESVWDARAAAHTPHSTSSSSPFRNLVGLRKPAGALAPAAPGAPFDAALLPRQHFLLRVRAPHTPDADAPTSPLIDTDLVEAAWLKLLGAAATDGATHDGDSASDDVEPSSTVLNSICWASASDGVVCHTELAADSAALAAAAAVVEAGERSRPLSAFLADLHLPCGSSLEMQTPDGQVGHATCKGFPSTTLCCSANGAAAAAAQGAADARGAARAAWDALRHGGDAAQKGAAAAAAAAATTLLSGGTGAAATARSAVLSVAHLSHASGAALHSNLAAASAFISSHLPTVARAPTSDEPAAATAGTSTSTVSNLVCKMQEKLRALQAASNTVASRVASAGQESARRVVHAHVATATLVKHSGAATVTFFKQAGVTTAQRTNAAVRQVGRGGARGTGAISAAVGRAGSSAVAGVKGAGAAVRGVADRVKGLVMARRSVKA